MTRSVLILILLTALAGCGRAPESNPTQSTAPSKRADSEQLRQKLIARINRGGDINDPNVPRPLVTLEEFFEGNDDYGSIGYNFYPDQPAPHEFYALFKGIRDKPEVADVRVEVKDLEDPKGWPATDTVWIITSASAADVKEWLGERFRADDIVNGFSPQLHAVEPYQIPQGMQAIGVWWD